MGEITGISWARHTFNPWIGCTKISPACDGCYAEHLMDTRLGRAKWGPHGERVRTSAANWRQPNIWNQRAEKHGDRPFVFCASLADVFDNQVETEWRADLFDLIAATPRLIWLLLTKRPQNILKLWRATGRPWPANATIGATCEDQDRWDINVPALAEAKFFTGARMAFISAEPLLGPIDPRYAELTPALRELYDGNAWFDPISPYQDRRIKIDWIITGGETDQGAHKARPSNPRWFRDLRDACAVTATAYHHKQNGEWAAAPEILEAGGPSFHLFDDGIWVQRVGNRSSGRTLDGREHLAFPQVAA